MYHKLKSLDFLESFVKICDAQSLTLAAEKMGVTTSSLSKHLTQLENELNISLIERNTRTLRVTEAGEKLYKTALAALANLRACEEELTSLESKKSFVKISCPFILCEEVFKALYFVQKENPHLQLDVEGDNSYLNLIEENVDIAIRIGASLNESAFHAKKVCEFKKVLCASPQYLKNHPKILSPGDLSQHNCLLYYVKNLNKKFIFLKGSQRETVTIHGTIQTNSSFALRTQVLSGFCIGHIPYFIVKSDLQSGALIEVLPEYKIEESQVFLLYSKNKLRSKIIKSCIDSLQVNLKKHLI